MSNEQETLLLVDDEENVLSSLRRLFRPDGYFILSASSAEAGLKLLETNHVDLLISDSMMPGMDGAAFLQLVRERWPDIVRIMLTGKADTRSAIAAINRGEVFRFIAKPWDPSELRITIKQGLEHRQLVEENERLQRLTQEQNIKLMCWNENLLRIAEERDTRLRQRNEELDSFHRELKQSVLRTCRTLMAFLEHGYHDLASHSRRTALLARQVADEMHLSEELAQDLELAAQLHDIGKLGLPHAALLLENHRDLLQGDVHFRQHPVIGQAVLGFSVPIEPIGLMIRGHHERWDGTGFPDGLRQEEISPGARIIAACDRYDHEVVSAGRDAADAWARSHAHRDAEVQYDPMVVQALLQVISRSDGPGNDLRQEISMPIRDLREEAVLARDLCTITGVPVLHEGERVTREDMSRLAEYEKNKLVCGPAVVYYPRSSAATGS